MYETLIRRVEIIEPLIVPVGLMSEEVQEAIHKHLKRFI